MKTSQAGVDLIKSFEGVFYNAYVCPAGILTIGYGHTGPDVKSDSRVDPQQAENLLKKDLASAEQAVSNLVQVALNQVQFDALVSFVYNIGEGAFTASTLLKRLNTGENPNTVAAEELPRWNKGDKGGVLQGLMRRRLAEVELFCQAPPQPKTDNVDITSIRMTLLKKRPVPSSELNDTEKAKVIQNRVIRNCTVLDHKDKHTYLELGFGLGKWWIFDEHWTGLVTPTGVKPYAIDGKLHYLRNFPYFYQQNNGPEGWRQCQTSSIAMCLRYMDVPGINDDTDYLKIVNKYGDTTYRESHFSALKELNVYSKFTISAHEEDVKDEIDQGRPIVAGILHHGTTSNPTGGGHFIVITGYDEESQSWLAQDPYGELDLVNGSWAATGAVSGKNIRYSYKNLNPRLFMQGGANGWCWLNFKRN